MGTDNLTPLLPVLLDEHHVPPGGPAKMAGIVIRIARPNEAIIGDVVPFFTRDFASLATDAHSRISKEPNLYTIAHVGMAALIRAFCALADHGTR